MGLTTREEQMLREIIYWQEELLQKEGLPTQKSADSFIEGLFRKIPAKKQEVFFKSVDSWLFHLNAFIQNSQIQEDERKRLLIQARVFDESIEKLEDMRKLPIHIPAYIVDHQIAKQRVYSFGQGALTGMGGILLLGIDLPAMAVMNLRAVQIVAMGYGFDVNRPHEMMLALKVFHSATLPTRLQQGAWVQLMQEVTNQREDAFFYEGEEDLMDYTWLEQPMKQLFKMLAIYSLRRKIVQGIPVLGVAIGATANYRLSRQVTEFANKFYQMRLLMEKSKK